MFLTGRTETKISLKIAAKTNFKVFWIIVSTGLPSMIRQGLNSTATVVLNYQCAFYGDAAVAAMSIVSRIIFFAFSVALGIGQGFQPVAGFNYGAGKYSRLRRGYRFTILLSGAIIIIGCVFLITFSENLIYLFRDDAEVVKIGARALRLQALAQLVMPVCMATEMLFQCVGKRLSASIQSSLRSGAIFIPLLIILANVRGIAGIQEAQPLSFLLSLPVSIAYAVWFFRTLPKEDRQDA